MKVYSQDEYLMLSGIQHFAFCKRQWALIYIENLWEDNYHTVIGNVFHEKVHNKAITEKKGNIIISKGMPIYSPTLGISGECDVVEFHLDKNGVEISGRLGKYIPYPVEYKKGSPKKTDIDILQLVAQGMCLEEMFCCDIQFGYLFYGQTRHREKVEINNELKAKAMDMINNMHMLFKRGHTPKVKPSKSCRLCSLKDFCLPLLCKDKSAKEYIKKMISKG